MRLRRGRMDEWASEGFLVWLRPGPQRTQARRYFARLSEALWDQSRGWQNRTFFSLSLIHI
eukprot:13969044-Alexandrium_andersonii.AAC.1